MASPHLFPSDRRLHRPRLHPRKRAAFTLVEMLVSTAVLGLLLIVLSSVTESASRAWREGQNRTDTFQSARTSLELMSRELTPAVVDTRMQFVVGPVSILGNAVRKTNPTLADKFAPNSPVILWMAPLGEEGSLRCVGYYLFRDPVKNLHRLKRIYIAPPEPGVGKNYFPKMVNKDTLRTDTNLRTSPINANWFTREWNAEAFDEQTEDNPNLVVSTVADGVIAFWVQCYDVLGNPIPLLSKPSKHPASVLHFNSAAYFQQATSSAFENGSFTYLAETAQSMKANKVPAAVELTVVTLDNAILARGGEIPPQTNPAAGGYLDVDAAVGELQEALKAKNIHNARVFRTRARLNNGN